MSTSFLIHSVLRPILLGTMQYTMMIGASRLLPSSLELSWQLLAFAIPNYLIADLTGHASVFMQVRPGKGLRVLAGYGAMVAIAIAAGRVLGPGHAAMVVFGGVFFAIPTGVLFARDELELQADFGASLE